MFFRRTIIDLNEALKILQLMNNFVNVFIYGRMHVPFRKSIRIHKPKQHDHVLKNGDVGDKKHVGGGKNVVEKANGTCDIQMKDIDR